MGSKVVKYVAASIAAVTGSIVAGCVAAGFGLYGVIAGSAAAAIQSSIGNVAAGSAFAIT